MIPGRQEGEDPSQEVSEPSSWRLVLGLGNPGEEYDSTRHNVGFEALDLCAARFQVDWMVRERALVAELPEFRCTLVKPLTFMNRSGIALRQNWMHHGLEDPVSIFIVTDDFHLALGGLRIRAEPE